jgi:lipopolysaccharide export system protein LptC
VTGTPSIAPARRDARALFAGVRYRVPSAAVLARRRRAIRFTKLMMPALALGLLGSLVLWPELQRDFSHVKAAAQLVGHVQGDTVVDARYSSVDARGRPYTVTAASARQADKERVDLTEPKADITLENGTWLMLQARDGIYRQHDNGLDLLNGVTLYRDDGTTVVTRNATLDLKAGAAAGTDPVHATGPFGTLDAKGGFTAADKGSDVLFAGPAHLSLNGADAK